MNQSQVTLKRIAGLDYDIRSNMIIDSVVKDTVSQILESVEDDDIKLQVGKVWVDHKYDNSDIGAQKEVRNKGQVWADELRADLSIVDKKTGKTIDSVGGIKVANIPKVTDRGTFIIKGNEYQFAKQSRLKPGVYTKVQSNGEISSFFNVDKTIDFDRGFNNNFKINFEPERKVFTMGYGTKNVPLINALRALGVSDSEMRNKWGEDVYSANAGAYDRHDVVNTNKLYEAVFGRRPQSTDTQESVQKQIRDRLFKTELDPNVTKITLGTAYKNVNKGALLDASKKIIDIHKGDVDGDDRESLVFKSFYDVEDHIRERLVKNSGKIINNMKFKLNKNRSINRSISSQMFDPFVVGSITSNQLSTPPNQTNPMSIIGETTKVMVVGEGGIGTPSAITNEARQISNSEAGFMDPLHTPEGGAIGVTTHLTVGTVKVGNDIYGKFVDKKGEEHMLSPMDAHDKNVAFPDEYKTVNGKLVPKSKKIRVIGSGKLKEVDASDVDYIIPAPERMFDTSVNLIPFLDSIQGNRGLTASKMQEQALSLVNRDSPLVEVVSDSGKPISQVLGGLFATPKSPVEGEVISVHPDKIIIETDKGDEQVVNLYHNFSLNSESYLNNDPVVKVGDKVNISCQLKADGTLEGVDAMVLP